MLMAQFQSWLVHQKFIRIDKPLDNRLTQSPDPSDHDDVAISAFRIQGKNDPGGCPVRADHTLNPD